MSKKLLRDILTPKKEHDYEVIDHLGHDHVKARNRNDNLYDVFKMDKSKCLDNTLPPIGSYFNSKDHKRVS